MGASNHRSDGLRIFGVMPEIEKLYGDRFRLTFRCDTKGNVEDWYYRNKSDLFTEFGTLMDAGFGTSPETPDPDSTWPNQRLIEHGLEYLQGKETPIVKFIYETLTDTFVEESQEKVDYELNGLRRVTRTLIARDTATYTKDVGVATINHSGRGRDSIELTLSSAVEDSLRSNLGGFIRIKETWFEAGVLSRREDRVGSQQSLVIEAIGLVPGTPSGYELASTDVSNFEGYRTNRYTFLKPSILSETTQTRNNGALTITTIEAFNEVPVGPGVKINDIESDVEGIPTRRYTFASGDGQVSISTRPGQIEGTTEVTVVSYGTPVELGGVLIASQDEERDGYVQYTRTTIKGAIVGEKTSWTDVVDVTVPGTVDLVTRSVTAGPLDGTVAVINNTPPRSKKIAATVTVEVTTTPPTDTSRAYDLGSISCSVDATQANYAALGTDVFETKSGNQRFSGAKGRGSISARIVSFPGSYLLNSGPVSGSFSYIGGWENSSTSPNTLLTNALTSSITNTLSGNGSTSESDFSTSGILQRKVRPIITALDGTIYWEVVTWRV